MIRSAVKPRRRASERYSSTTPLTSRGWTVWRSKTSVTGMRTGMKCENPVCFRIEADRAFLLNSARLTESAGVLQLVLAHELLHLIFEMKFEFFQTMLFHLFIGSQGVLCFKGLDLPLVLMVLLHEMAEFFIRLH